MASIRKQLITKLRVAFPSKEWRFVDDERSIDRLTLPGIILSQRTLRRSPAAPIGAHVVSFIMTVIDPNADISKAENSLDDRLDTALHVLDGTHNLNWTEARKVVWQDRYLAYDIDLEVTSKK